jgi:hypothetical protein
VGAYVAVVRRPRLHGRPGKDGSQRNSRHFIKGANRFQRLKRRIVAGYSSRFCLQYFEFGTLAPEAKTFFRTRRVSVMNQGAEGGK